MTNSESFSRYMAIPGPRTITIFTKLFCVPSPLGPLVPALPSDLGRMVMARRSGLRPRLSSVAMRLTALKSVEIIILLKGATETLVLLSMFAIVRLVPGSVRGNIGGVIMLLFSNDYLRLPQVSIFPHGRGSWLRTLTESS